MILHVDVPNNLMDRDKRVGAIVTAAAWARATVTINPKAVAEAYEANQPWKARYVELCAFLQRVIDEADDLAVDVLVDRDDLARLRPFLQWAVES